MQLLSGFHILPQARDKRHKVHLLLLVWLLQQNTKKLIIRSMSLLLMSESKSLRVAYGEALAELGAKNDKIVVMDADLSHATMTSIFAAAEINGPIYIRVARPIVETITTDETPFIPGKANIVKDGSDICIMATGLMLSEALKAADMLATEGINASVINFHTIKPFDTECVLKMAEQCGAVVTAEEHSIIGGLGSAVAEDLAGHSGAKFVRVGIQDKFGKSGKPADLFAAYGLTAENITAQCRFLIK